MWLLWALLWAGLLGGAADNPHLLRGIELLRQADYKAAAQELDAAVKLDPRSDRALLNLGIARAQLGEPGEAERAFRAALRLNPSSAEAHYNLGLVLAQRGQRGEAVAELSRATRLAPANPDIRYNLGTLLLELGKPAEAIPQLEKAADLQPRLETLVQLGRARVQAGRPKQAIEALDRVPPLYRKLPQIRRLRAEAYAADGNYDGAFAEIEAALREDPRRPDDLLFQAKIYQKVGNPQAALPLLEMAERWDPASAEIPYSSGFSYYVLEDHAAAARKLSQAIERNKRFDRAYFLLGIIRLTQGEFSQGFQMLDRAVQLQPTNVFYRTVQGMGLLWQDRVEEAAATLRQATRLAPGYGLAHYQLGKALTRQEKIDEAARELETALRLKPDLTEVLYRLGQLYASLGREQDSRRVLRLFREKQQAPPAAEPTPRQELLDRVREGLQPK